MKEEVASPPLPYLSEVPSAEFLFVHLSAFPNVKHLVIIVKSQ